MVSAIDICEVPIEEYYYEAFINFSSPPWSSAPPLIQGVLLPIEHINEPIDISNLLEKAAKDPSLLSPYELNLLCGKVLINNFFLDFKFINFSEPFDQLFAYGVQILNIKHHSAEKLLQFICKLISSKKHKILSSELGKLDDLVSKLFSLATFKHLTIEEGDVVTDILNHIWEAAKELKEFGEMNGQIIPGPEDFVPGTIIDPKDVEGYRNIFGQVSDFKDFGAPL